MSTGTGPTPAPRRRAPRRAVRPPGTVGTDESVLRSTLPAAGGAAAAHEAGADGADEAGADGADEAGAVGEAGEVTAGEARAAASVTAAPRPAPVVPDAPDPWSATRSADDGDRGWGREEPSGNDDRLHRERPPHW